MLASVAQASEGETTQQRIDTHEVISLGHRESSIPFSYYDDKRHVVGYSQDMAAKIVEAVRTRLGKPDLQVKLTPITSQNRIPLLTNGTIDIECGSTTNNAERARQVAFSNTIFVIGTRLMTRIDSGIKDFPDLRDKTVVTTAGTTSERLLRKMNQEQHMTCASSARRTMGTPSSPCRRAARPPSCSTMRCSQANAKNRISPATS